MRNNWQNARKNGCNTAILGIRKHVAEKIAHSIRIARYEGGDYVNPEFENDASHLLRRPKAWWIRIGERYGYKCMVSEDSKLLHEKTGMIMVKCELNR